MKKLFVVVIVMWSTISQPVFAVEANYENTQSQHKAIELAQANPVLDTTQIQQQVSEKLQEKIQADFEIWYEKIFDLNN